MKKRLLSIILTVFLVLSMVPYAAFADDSIVCPACGGTVEKHSFHLVGNYWDFFKCNTCGKWAYLSGITGLKLFSAGDQQILNSADANAILNFAFNDGHLIPAKQVPTGIGRKDLPGYASDDGTPNYASNGELQIVVYPRLGSSPSNMYDYTTYSPQKAQDRADYMRTAHGPDLKIANRRDYLAALEAYILTGSSPEDAIHQVGDAFGITISKTTCYRYIEMKLFQTLRYKHLPQGHPKTGKGRGSHSNIANPGHRSIERRAKEVQDREAIGHWEIDSVIGKAVGQKESLLVISERKTRTEIILKAESKTASETVRQLRRLRRYFGRDWKTIFHTLTSDNGPEFADQSGIDALGVTMFYCHPQSPHERGTNEVTNKLIRRKFPKGQSLAHVTQTQAAEVQYWVNHYSRPMFGGRCAADVLKEELDRLPLYNREKVYRFFGLL